MAWVSGNEWGAVFDCPLSFEAKDAKKHPRPAAANQEEILSTLKNTPSHKV